MSGKGHSEIKKCENHCDVKVKRTGNSSSGHAT